MKLAPLVFIYPVRSPDRARTPIESLGALPAGALALPCIDSGAFGDGTHPTTRLCAGAVDFLARQSALEAALDVGTGTGILARIVRARWHARSHARRLARSQPRAQAAVVGIPPCFVAATDINPLALTAARANARLDSGAPEITIGEFPPDHWGPRFDLVVANILEAPLRELAPMLARALVPGGTLMISGFTRLQSPGLREVFRAQGLTPTGDAVLDEWVLSSFLR